MYTQIFLSLVYFAENDYHKTFFFISNTNELAIFDNKIRESSKQGTQLEKIVLIKENYYLHPFKRSMYIFVVDLHYILLWPLRS